MWLRLELHTFLILEVIMPNYDLLYKTLFNAITDAIEHIDNADSDMARTVLASAQKLTEELYIETSSS